MNQVFDEYIGKRCELTLHNMRDCFEDVTLLSYNDEWLKVLNEKDIIFIRMSDISSIRFFIS